MNLNKILNNNKKILNNFIYSKAFFFNFYHIGIYDN